MPIPISDLRKKFDSIAGMGGVKDKIEGQSELMKLALEIGKSDLSSQEKDFFFQELKDKCLADDGMLSRQEFEGLLNKIEGKRAQRQPPKL